MISRRTQTVVTRAHAWVYRLSRGRVGGRLLGMEQVLLTTTGRSSGRPRTTPLSAFPLDDEHDGTAGTAVRGGVVLVASDGGQPRHPQWYRNLCVNPEVIVRRGPRSVPMRARTATAAERARLWPGVVAAHGGYADYQERTDREIPLVICEPR